jgi:hypothetical protein
MASSAAGSQSGSALVHLAASIQTASTPNITTSGQALASALDSEAGSGRPAASTAASVTSPATAATPTREAAAGQDRMTAPLDNILPPSPIATGAFLSSYAAHKKWPGRPAIVEGSIYGDSALQAHYTKFRAKQAVLFVQEDLADPDSRKVKVPVRDILDDGQVHKRNLKTEQKLKQWLGDESTDDAPNASLVTKMDPRCRFV